MSTATRIVSLGIAAVCAVTAFSSCARETSLEALRVDRFVARVPLGTEYLEENIYLVYAPDSREGIIIDPGVSSRELERRIAAEDIHVAAVLNTHGHFDHVGANGTYGPRFGVDVYADYSDADLYQRFTAEVDASDAPTVDLSGETELELGGHKIGVIHTPGHTPGSLCFLVDGVLFSGDSLFKGAVGRTEDTQAAQLLLEGIRQELLTLPDDTLVYPGHGESTTIGAEKEGNPFLQEGL